METLELRWKILLSDSPETFMLKKLLADVFIYRTNWLITADSEPSCKLFACQKSDKKHVGFATCNPVESSQIVKFRLDGKAHK